MNIIPYKGTDGKYHYIYKTINKINNKFYIGKHSTFNFNDNYIGSGTLLKAAIKKYGLSNFSKKILEFSNTEEDVYELEKQYITKDLVDNDMCYNLVVGGAGAKLETMSIIKKISQYELDGTFIRHWNSITEAAIYYNISVSNLTAALHGTIHTVVQYQWRYYNNSKEPIENKSYINLVTNVNSHNKFVFSKKVNQYDINGIFIKTWDNAVEISKYYNCNVNDIYKVLINLRQSNNDFMYKYYDGTTTNIKGKVFKHFKRTVKLSKDGVLLNIYDNAAIAARENNIKPTTLHSWLTKRSKNKYIKNNYIWMYEHEYNDMMKNKMIK